MIAIKENEMAKRKTKEMMLTREKMYRTLDFQVEGMNIVAGHHAKYLGNILDTGGTLGKHIKK